MAAPLDISSVRRLCVRLFACSFAALFLELMVIRWVPAVIRLVAYYANLMLISSFLGLGLGAILATRRRNLFRWFPVVLALDVGLLLLCRNMALGAAGAEARFFPASRELVNSIMLLGVFTMNTAVFVPLGEEIGRLFAQLPALRAYYWDLGGSLCGTLGFAVFSLFYFSPVLGIGLVVLIFLELAPRRALWWAAPVLFAALVGIHFSTDKGALWSPYYYIAVRLNGPMPPPVVTEPPPNLRTMRDPPAFAVTVNQDFYQDHATLDPARYTPDRLTARLVELLRLQYSLPSTIAPRRDRVAVMGAGGGIDVEAALLAGAKHVDAVEIDRALVSLSHKFNA